MTANKNANVMLGVFCLGLATQIFMLQRSQILTLQTELAFATRAHAIDRDQIADISYQLLQLKNQQETDNIRQYVAGAAAVLNKPEYYEQIWHAGYDRGTAVQQYTQNAETQPVRTSVKQSKNDP